MTVVLARRTRAVSARFYGVLDLEFAISDSVLFQPESRRTRVKSWRHSRNICRRGVKIPFVAGLWEKNTRIEIEHLACVIQHGTCYLLGFVPKILIFSPIFFGFFSYPMRFPAERRLGQKRPWWRPLMASSLSRKCEVTLTRWPSTASQRSDVTFRGSLLLFLNQNHNLQQKKCQRCGCLKVRGTAGSTSTNFRVEIRNCLISISPQHQLRQAQRRKSVVFETTWKHQKHMFISIETEPIYLRIPKGLKRW